MSPTALETHAVGRRYGATWALKDCTLELPRHRVTALVGPNGAGKTTLLHLAVGLTSPSSGTVRVFGRAPQDEAAEVLPRIGFVAQDHPLLRGFSIGDLLTMGRKLNPQWDEGLARTRLDRFSLDLRRKASSLSGGEQAQVALSLALAKRPEFLLLDEPVASLDPLARRDFLQLVLEAVAEEGLTVLLSSHIIAELERVSDHLVILAEGHVQLSGDIDEVVARHRLLTGPRCDPRSVARLHDVVHESHAERQTTLLVRADGHIYDAAWEVHEAGLEEIVLAYLGHGAAGHAKATTLEEAS
jgi:ABC-2 type transport system ATP-binding protein